MCSKITKYAIRKWLNLCYIRDVSKKRRPKKHLKIQAFLKKHKVCVCVVHRLRLPYTTWYFFLLPILAVQVRELSKLIWKCFASSCT